MKRHSKRTARELTRWVGGVTTLMTVALACATNTAVEDDSSVPRCGDGLIDQSNGEQCDDGNNNNGDGCSAVCVLEQGGSQVAGVGGSAQASSSVAQGSGGSSVASSSAAQGTGGSGQASSSAAQGTGGSGQASSSAAQGSGGSSVASTSAAQGTGGMMGGSTTCPNPTVLTCGSMVTGTTIGGPKNIAAVGCNGVGVPGPEAYYTFTSASNKNVTVTLAGVGNQDLDLAIVGEKNGDCDPKDCYAWGWGSTNMEQEQFKAASNVTYYIIVESSFTIGADFSLTVSCI